MNDADKAQTLLKQVRAIAIKYAGVNAREQYDFNVFSIVRDSHEEVGLHSSFLHALFSPDGGHGQGLCFLNEFLSQVGLDSFPDDSEVHVFREYTKLHKDEGGKPKRDSIDIYIKSGDRAIIVENKVYAADQHMQLCRYTRLAMNENFEPKNIDIVYLSLDGHPPPPGRGEVDGVEFVIDEKEDGDPIIRIGKSQEIPIKLVSYAGHVIPWLDGCIAQMATYPTTRETLVLYQRIVKQLCGQSMNEEEQMEVVDILINTPDEFEMAKNVCAALPRAKAKIQLRFWRELEEALSKRGMDKVEQHNQKSTKEQMDQYYHAKRGKSWYSLKYELGCLQSDPSATVLFYIEREDNIYYGVIVQTETNQWEKCLEITEALKDYNYKGEAWWPAWRYPRDESGAHKLEINFKTFEDFALKLVDDQFRGEYIDNLAEEVKHAYDECKTELTNKGILDEHLE